MNSLYIMTCKSKQYRWREMNRKPAIKSEWDRLSKAWSSGRIASTLILARRFVKAWPDFGQAWAVLGTTLVSLARYEEAEVALQRSIGLCESDSKRIAFAFMGELFKKKGEFETAIEWYNRAVELAPDHASSYIYLGMVLIDQGRLCDAEKILRKGVLCDRGCIEEAHFNLGFVLLAQDRHEEAADCFREAIQYDPEYRSAKNALKDVERCLKLLREA